MMFNFYGVTFVPINNNITLKMAAIAAKTCW
jgi:hypothetical protein